MAELSLDERMASVKAAANAAARRTPEAARAILESRARQLARPADREEDTGELLELLVVQVGDERLALPLAAIVAIARAGSIAPIPRASRPVYGVTSWRGRPLTVLSLQPSRPTLTAESRLIVLGSGDRAALGVVVDAVHDAARTARAGLSPAGPGPRRAYALGITPEGLLVVDGDALLHPEKLSA